MRALRRRHGRANSQQQRALLALYKSATSWEGRQGNPYSKPEVRAALRALGDPHGFDKPAKRPGGRAAGALYDLVDFITSGDRQGNPHTRAAVKEANRALGGDGFNLPQETRR